MESIFPVKSISNSYCFAKKIKISETVAFEKLLVIMTLFNCGSILIFSLCALASALKKSGKTILLTFKSAFSLSPGASITILSNFSFSC